MNDSIRDLRTSIDALAQLNATTRMPNNTKIEQATEALFMSKAWLGKTLQFHKTTAQEVLETAVEIANEDQDSAIPPANVGSNGYAMDGKRETVADIEPTKEQAETIPTPKGWVEWTHVKRIDYVREEIGGLVSALTGIFKDKPQSREEAIARTKAYEYLCEARFYLGFKLGEIREGK